MIVSERMVAVVLNWNGEDDTVACIESLRAQRDVELEILLVDNASADGSGERLHTRYPGMAYLQTGANLGYAGGNDRGIEWALAQGAAWVLIVNNDTVADPDCVRLLREGALGDDRMAGVAPLITRFDDPKRVWFAGGRLDAVRALGTHDHDGELVSDVVSQAADGSTVTPCSFLCGCCILFRAAALREVGGFREDFFAYVEDVELSYRLGRAGWRLGWMPAARLAHRVPACSAPPSAWQLRLRDRNRRRMARDLYPWPLRAAFWLWFWPTRVMHLIRYRLVGDGARADAILAGMRER